MTQSRKLAPHEADLVEADAREMWEARRLHHGSLKAWEAVEEETRDVFRDLAANPYRVPQLPNPKDLRK